MKKKRPYIITIVIALIMFLVLFISKGIFPFGNNSLIWGDMHDQITAFYYHFYDSFRGTSSLFVDFSSSGGINFFGILAYYILSPFSLIVLLFERDKIYLVVSIIIALKMILSSVTCLYMIRTFFKKIPEHYTVLLAILYGFNAYNILMYQITPWIDVVYLFPLILIGLKKVLDGKNPVMYISLMTLSIILCFYVSYMSLIFIFFASFIYLLVYRKDERKKGILNLGISTILAILMSTFIVIPAYKQISISSRLDIDINKMLNSQTGPITDKIVFFLMGAFLIALILLLVKDYKEHKKFLFFYLPTIFLVLIPIIIEPVNKLLHFGSYAFFPNRFGFISQLLLIIGAAYYINNKQLKEENKISLKKKSISIVLTIIPVLLNIFITKTYYNLFQTNIYTLTISGNRKLILLLILIFIINLITILAILIINKNKKLFACILISTITIVNLMCMSFLYIGIDYAQDTLTSQYEDMSLIEKTYKTGDYHRIKNLYSNLIMNSSLVTRYHNLDHFTSLTEANNLTSLKKLGYSSMWVKTFSSGGTMFTDLLFANKYLISKEDYNNEYYKYIDTFGKIKFYELKQDISYGYFIDNNDTIFDKENSFEIQNSLYQNITNNNKKLFTFSSDFKLKNIETSKSNNYTNYEIIDSSSYSYIEKTIKVKEKQELYLEILKSLTNSINTEIYEKTNIYINDKLYEAKYPNKDSNGILDLGTYENETVNIKIEFDESLSLDNITLGMMNLDLYEDFIKDEKLDAVIKFSKNKVNISVTSDKKTTLFLPLTYSDSYRAKVNGKNIKVIKLYENYVGVEVDDGVNEIELTYVPAGFNTGLIISITSLLITFVLLKTKLYYKILDSHQLENIVNILYTLMYLLLLILVYILPTICFIISYFVVINL